MKNARPDDKTIFGTWIAGYESRDVAKVMSIFDADLQYHAPCQPVQNFEALENWFEYDFSRKDPRPTWSFRTESIDVSGDLAVIVSRWSAVTNLDGFSANLERLRSIDFLRFGEQGWKIFRTINDPEDCGTPPKLAREKKDKKDKKRSKKR
jgi:ketosteroid isomerase-like protein